MRSAAVRKASSSTLLPRVEAADRLIRSGELGKAREALADLAPAAIPRTEVVRIAQVCRRAGLNDLALRALNPIIRQSRKSPLPATEGEKAEYAACLIKCGAGDEALALLRGLDPAAVPEARYHAAAAHMDHWDYAEALPLLRAFVASEGVAEYPRLVGRVNLAAALIARNRFEDAAPLLENLRTETRDGNHLRLHGNCLELSAQSAILQKKWEEGEAWLEAARTFLHDTHELDRFFIRKWSAISAFTRDPQAPAARAFLHAIRDEAVQRGHWETSRDCDRYEATRTGNVALFQRVYFGTPYPHFREELLKELSAPLDLPDAYAWSLGSGGGGAVLDLRNGEVNGKRSDLKLGFLLHRLLGVMTSDFYRPIRIASLHAKIYPNEHFNPESSPMRVHMALQRLRKWFRALKLPLELEESGGAYRLEAESSCRLVVPREDSPASKEAAAIQLLRAQWPEGPFSTREASKLLGKSERTTSRVLEQLRREGTLERSGAATATRYFVVKTKAAA